MLNVAVTLVKDTPDNLRRFVSLNLRHGLDHLVVVLDGPQEVPGEIAEDPRVTVVVADDAWWLGATLDSLNGRQRVVANFVRAASARLGWVDWLFFLDGDEVALLDRDVLADVPADVSAARLWPLESVSDPDHGGHLFKRLLSDEQLRDLTDQGLLTRASNAVHFHGHTSGKVGVRPHENLRLWIHTAVDERGQKVTRFEHPALRHLHFESQTFDEFVRKWTALAASGQPPAMRHRRAKILAAFLRLRDEPDPQVRARTHRRLYQRFVAEDAQRLERAGVLERIDPAAATYEPQLLTDVQRDELVRELALMARVPKRLFLPEVATEELAAVVRAAERDR